MHDVPVLQALDLGLSYGPTRALDDVSIALYPGEAVALMGPSGSGKSSLLHCLAGVLQPDHGSVTFRSAPFSDLGMDERSRLRLSSMGMVFQFANLIAELSLLENVALPSEMLGLPRREAREKAITAMAALGVADVADRFPGQVSGGQAQRVAVARALAHRPAVLFADEPTGALDSLNAQKVLEGLLGVAHETGTAVLVVTHDSRVAAYCRRLVTLVDGRIQAPGVAM